jgi:hypothetical protein
MKYIFILICIVFYTINSFSQFYSGQLSDKESGQPVSYANIGIVGKNIGTASDAAGKFKLELDSKYNKDTLSISCIGYENINYLISDFKNDIRNIDQFNIELSPKTYQLDEVIIKPFDTQIYTLGNFCEANSAYGNAFYSKELGTEMGVSIKLPKNKSTAYLQSFRFYIGELTYDTFPVRLNVYNLKNGKPYENVLTVPILIEIASSGEYVIDLKNYKIISSGDFFISLEYYRICEGNEGQLVFCATANEEKNEGNSYFRLTSQGNWIPEIVAGVGFSVQVLCEE